MTPEYYKGYLIHLNPMNGQWWIEKNGHRLSWANDVDDAKRIIDDVWCIDVYPDPKARVRP